jgi:ankyrin repeat protein
MDESQCEEGDTPLWAAVFHRRLEVALFLVAHGADATCANGNGIALTQVNEDAERSRSR